jgi:hypothetical protein
MIVLCLLPKSINNDAWVPYHTHSDNWSISGCQNQLRDFKYLPDLNTSSNQIMMQLLGNSYCFWFPLCHIDIVSTCLSLTAYLQLQLSTFVQNTYSIEATFIDLLHGCETRLWSKPTQNLFMLAEIKHTRQWYVTSRYRCWSMQMTSQRHNLQTADYRKR